MLRLTLAAALALALAVPLAGAQGLPAPLEAYAAENARACGAMGGAPRVGPAFATAIDLTGDGAPDYVVDLAGIECANAWSAFCDAAGCPVSVWIARPGGLVREWAGDAQAWTIEGMGEDMAVVVEQQGAACPEAAEACSRRLTFEASPAATDAPDPAAASVAGEPPPPGAEPAAPVPPPAALAAPGVAGWTLRDVPGSTPVAVSDGPGAIASVALFCLAGQPWLAASFDAPPAGETAEIAFAFPDQAASVAARREDGAGGAYIVELADQPLAGLLAGRASAVGMSVDGAEQGTLSLRGSTRAIRAALASCPAG